MNILINKYIRTMSNNQIVDRMRIDDGDEIAQPIEYSKVPHDIQHHIDDFETKLQTKPIIYQLKYKRFDFYLFDDIKKTFLRHLGPNGQYMKNSVAFNALAYRTIFVKNVDEANAIKNYIETKNIQMPYGIEILPSINGVIDTSILAKQYQFAENLVQGKRLLKEKAGVIVITKSGIVMHPNGRFQCGKSFVFDEVTSKEEWNLEDCLDVMKDKVKI